MADRNLPETLHDLEKTAARHLWFHGPEESWEELTEQEGMRVFARGEGSTIWDVRGRAYLDGLSGLFVVNAGHGRREIGEAMAEQAGRIAYSAASTCSNDAAVLLAEKLSGITPGDLSRVFLVSGGSEAVETAIKIARQAQAMRGFQGRYKIIARRGSYHGMTLGAMSLTAARVEKYHGPFMYGVCHVPSPNRYHNDFGLSGENGDLMCARYVEQEIQHQGPETVAAVIGEPVSVSNGNHVPSPRYWQMLRDICDRYGVFLIMDEAINGFGRTGKMFAAEHFGVVPDMMAIAKGFSSGYAPIGGVIVRGEIFEGFTGDGRPIEHLLTFGGHAVASAAALRNIRIIEDEDLVERSARSGAYLMEGLHTLESHPTVGDVRGIGLMCSVELVKNRKTRESWGWTHAFTKDLAERIRDRGLLTRVWGVLHLGPPLVITRDEIDSIISIIDESLTETENRFASEIA